jgi:glycosyltransferase involved in cell wall biosynthesis
MKVLFVVEHFYPYVGGAEELFLNLATSLAAAGYEVEVVTTRHDNLVKEFEEYRGVKINRVNCYNRFLFTVLSLPLIIRKAKKASFIHTTSYNSAIPAFLAGFFTRRRVIITFHEVWGRLWFTLPFTRRWKLSAFYLYEKFILTLPFYRYIAVSDYTSGSLLAQGIPQEKIIKIYNGFDYEQLADYPHSPAENFTFCFFGRLGISKGLDLLLEAAPLFISRHPEATFKLIIPTYPEKLFRQVKRQIRLSGIEKNLVLLHNLPKDKLWKEVSSSSCVIIPSYSEGFCYVAVESAGMTVPIISSGKGSLPEVVGGKFITLERLDASSINDALEQALKGNWNFRAPKKFPWDTCLEQYIELYKLPGNR